MYKCKECGTEYETKPDYCDCGNDTFDEILKSPQTPKIDVTNVTKLNKEEEPKELKVEKEVKKGVSKQVEIQSKTPQYDYSRLKQFFDPVSTTIFCVCVVLAILIVMFAGNSLLNENDEKSVEMPKQTQNVNIPDIDKLWNSTPPKATEQPNKAEAQSMQQQEAVEPSSKLVELPKLIKQETSKSVTKTQNKTVSQKQSSPQKQTQKVIQTKTASKPQNTQNTAVLKQEFNNYKLSLRNRMASRIDFARVVGDGECIVNFKIDSTGRLVNRSFAKQSDNDSLNDVVYNAVMSLPTFSAPPKGYNGETLHLRVNMYGGNFEVYLY